MFRSQDSPFLWEGPSFRLKLCSFCSECFTISCRLSLLAMHVFSASFWGSLYFSITSFTVSLLGIEFLVNRFKFFCLFLAWVDSHKRPILLLIFVTLCAVFCLLSLAASKTRFSLVSSLESISPGVLHRLFFCLFILFDGFSVLLGFEVWCLSLILEVSQPPSLLLFVHLLWLPVC